MIKKLANNPANLFSFALERLQRTPEWEIIEQVLGVLLASREPLSLHQLGQLIHVREYRLRKAISRLGGLLTTSAAKGQPEQCRYSLFHLMFQDFLGQNEQPSPNEHFFSPGEVEDYHVRIASWCEGEQLAPIWQDTKDQLEQERRAYARQHYITHLYLAKKWSQLFNVLDSDAYGRAKMQYDSSMRSYTLDLDLGRLAAASPDWSLEEGIEHLSHLWRYTLLQCSLVSHADNYPEEAFEFLLLLRQEARAIGLAELLTDLGRKAQILLRIAIHLEKQSDRKGESDRLFIRANEVAKIIEDADKREFALGKLAGALAQAGQWEQAQVVWKDAQATIAQIEDANNREIALGWLGGALAQAGQREQAQTIIAQIMDTYSRGQALSQLIDALSKVNKYERGLAVIQNCWLRAITRTEALDLLHIVSPFIALKPELSIKFFEAYLWADNFLKRFGNAN